MPPLDEVTGFFDFDPSEAGYAELVKLFDYLRSIGHVDDGQNGTAEEAIEMCVLDADDMLDDPEGILKAYCKSVGLEYTPQMLNWDNDEDQQRARDQFEKWPGFHDDALDSTCLKKREHVSCVILRSWFRY